MKTATTTQFRQAVRNASRKHNGHLSGTTWTDAPVLWLTATAKRYVAFQEFKDAVSVAKTAEQLLNKQGLTAKTRVTQDLYVRGTCVL